MTVIIALSTICYTGYTSFKNAPDPVKSTESKARHTSEESYAYKIPVFAYHRFCAELPWDEMGEGNYLFCEQKEFDKQMKYLHDNGYRTITSDELYRWHEGELELPKKTVMITMDDGNISVIKYALPILKKYGFTATVFMIGHSTYDVTDPNPYDTDSYHHMGIDMMKETQSSCDNIEFQSHSYNLHDSIHGERAVTVLSREELAADTAYMHDTYGYTCLAYPFGAYTDEMISVLEDNGNYTCAFTYGHDDYATRFDNRFKLERIKIYGGTSLEEFISWLNY